MRDAINPHAVIPTAATLANEPVDSINYTEWLPAFTGNNSAVG